MPYLSFLFGFSWFSFTWALLSLSVKVTWAFFFSYFDISGLALVAFVFDFSGAFYFDYFLAYLVPSVLPSPFLEGFYIYVFVYYLGF